MRATNQKKMRRVVCCYIRSIKSYKLNLLFFILLFFLCMYQLNLDEDSGETEGNEDEAANEGGVGSDGANEEGMEVVLQMREGMEVMVQMMRTEIGKEDGREYMDRVTIMLV